MEAWQYCDGGRQSAGYKGNARDCVVRAISIASGVPYKTIYDKIAIANKEIEGVKTARNGTHKKVYEPVLTELGFKWVKAPTFVGRKARSYDLPKDKIVIARMAHHLVAVINGVAFDTFDCTNKMVYGYWSK